MSNAKEILEIIYKKNKIHANTLANSVDKSGLTHIDEYCNYLLNNFDYTLEYIADSYLMIVKDTTIEQIKFLRSGTYRYSTFLQTNEKVYANKEYMQKYMIGLALSQFLWQNHKDIFNFFKNSILTLNSDRYLEIGCGHGIFFAEAIKSKNFDSYTAIDLSQTSIDLTKKYLNYRFNTIASNVELRLKNIFDIDTNERYDFIAMGEVLEHVEQPKLLVEKVHDLLTDSGYAFISSCTNCPAIDHIFLFEDVIEIQKMITDSNLNIVSEIILPATKLNVKNNKEVETINYAVLVKKNA